MESEKGRSHWFPSQVISSTGLLLCDEYEAIRLHEHGNAAGLCDEQKANDVVSRDTPITPCAEGPDDDFRNVHYALE